MKSDDSLVVNSAHSSSSAVTTSPFESDHSKGTMENFQQRQRQGFLIPSSYLPTESQHTLNSIHSGVGGLLNDESQRSELSQSLEEELHDLTAKNSKLDDDDPDDESECDYLCKIGRSCIWFLFSESNRNNSEVLRTPKYVVTSLLLLMANFFASGIKQRSVTLRNEITGSEITGFRNFV